MKPCVYCEHEFDNNETPVLVGGEPMHRECEVAFRHDWDEAGDESRTIHLAEEEADAILDHGPFELEFHTD